MVNCYNRDLHLLATEKKSAVCRYTSYYSCLLMFNQASTAFRLTRFEISSYIYSVTPSDDCDCCWWCLPLAYLWIRAARAGSEASSRADASAAAAPWASATVEWGLWFMLPLGKLLPLPEAALWLAEGLKWAANAKIILITDLRLPSTMSKNRKRTYTMFNNCLVNIDSSHYLF